MAAGSGRGKESDNHPDIAKIQATTDVVALVAHLDDPELSPNDNLPAMQKRLAAWTLGRKGEDGTAVMKVKRVSPQHLKKDCGELPVDLHSPFDLSQIPINWGGDGVFYLRLYWGPTKIASWYGVEFSGWPHGGQGEPPSQQVIQPNQIPVQVQGGQQQLLLQLITAITQNQDASNKRVADSLEAMGQAILASAQANQNQQPKEKGLFDELDKFSDVAAKLKKFQKVLGGFGGEQSEDESAWVGLARETIAEYGEDTLAGIFQVVQSFRKEDSGGENDTGDEVEGTVIVLPKATEGDGE